MMTPPPWHQDSCLPVGLEQGGGSMGQFPGLPWLAVWPARGERGPSPLGNLRGVWACPPREWAALLLRPTSLLED